MRQRPNLAIAIMCSLILIASSGAPSPADEQPPVATTVGVDPRVELVSIVFALAGGVAYNQPTQYRPYRDRVDRWFSRYENHPAVRYAIKLQHNRGIGFNAPMELAVRISPDPSMTLLVPLKPWPKRFDGRWTPHTVHAFLSRLRRFRRDSDFDAFFHENQPFYEEITARLTNVVQRDLHLEWFPSFFGSRELQEDEIHIVPGPLLGPCNYGPAVRIAGRLHRYAMIGVWRTDENGRPVFERGDVSTVVHEICHSFSNPVVRRWMNRLRPLFVTLRARHRKAFREQAYDDPEAIAYETMVRACVERYLLDTEGAAAAAEHEKDQREREFLWVGDLCRLLGVYENDRSKYPDLDAFMPRVMTFLEDWIAAHGASPPAPVGRS